MDTRVDKLSIYTIFPLLISVWMVMTIVLTQKRQVRLIDDNLNV